MHLSQVHWPDKVDPEPDPFTEEERDMLLDDYWWKDRHWFPFVFTQFFTGLRPGEAIGLRVVASTCGAADCGAGVSHARRGQPTEDEEDQAQDHAAPEVVAVLRDMPQPMHRPATLRVHHPDRAPVDEERFVEKHWHRALRATGMRPRKFYATRHTFISVALEPGDNIKWLADYCGTSVEMIERHYAGYLRDETPEEIPSVWADSPRHRVTPHTTQRSRRRRASKREPSREPFAARADHHGK